MEEMLRKANTADEDALWRFYEEICAAQAESPYTPSWHLGVYPAREDLEEHIAAGEFYFYLRGGQITAAAVLSAGEDPIYADAAWPTACAAEEVCVLHLFAVRPAYRRSGVSDAVLEALVSRAKAEGMHLLRLDVVTGNLPAERLYRKHGFSFAEEREVSYPDTGNICVRLFERAL